MKQLWRSWSFTGLPVVLCLLVLAGLLVEGGFSSLLTWQSALLLVLALGCEFVDSTLGMGYGTALTPLLLFMGFGPLEVVPAILCSELVTGLLAAFMHHQAGNVDFREGRHLRIALVLAGCSAVGAVAAVFIAVRIDPFYLKLYVGVLVFTMGLVILLLRGREGRFLWRKLVGLGVLASFNKGMSGGGYGPVVTCGQILSGLQGKRAVAITSLAEGITCAVGVTAFAVAGMWPHWEILAPIVLGAVVSTPLSAHTVSRAQSQNLTRMIGITTLLLGLLTLAKVLF